MQRPKSHRRLRFDRAKSLLPATWHVYWTERWNGEDTPQDVILAGFRTADSARQHILNTVDDVLAESIIVTPVPAIAGKEVMA